MVLVGNYAFKQTQGPTPHMYLSPVGPAGELVYRAGVIQREAKFALEHVSGDMVHIRSCFNNKYVIRLHGTSYSEFALGAKGVEPVADRTSPNCTLFKISMDAKKRVTFFHVETGRTARVSSSNTNYMNVDPAEETEAVSIAVDYDSLVTLPKFVAFKGSNGLYYKNYANGGYSSFVEKEIVDPMIVCQTHYTDDGHLRIQGPVYANGQITPFWAATGRATDPESLIVFLDSEPNSVGQMFDIIKIAANKIALRSRLNNLFCTRADFAHSARPKDRLVAKSKVMVSDTILEIVEPVYNRTVHVYEFDLDRARVYGVELLYTDNHIWDNYSDVAQSGSADGRIKTTKTTTYTNTVSVSASVSTNFDAGIPFIAEGHIEISATAGYNHEWGEITEEEQTVGHVFTVVVAPMKRTIARGSATRAKCDVPFSYTQRDYPTDGGPPRVTTLSDGVFKGANAYTFNSEFRYDKLPAKPERAPPEVHCLMSIAPFNEELHALFKELA